MLGMAMGVAVGAGLVLLVAKLADEVKPSLDKLGNDIHNSLFGSTGNSAPLLSDLPWPLGPKGAPDWAKIGTDTTTGFDTALLIPMKGTADQAGKAADDVTSNIARSFTGLGDHAEALGKTFTGIFDRFGPIFGGVGDHAESMGRRVRPVFVDTGSAFFSMKERMAADARRVAIIVADLTTKMIADAQALITGYYDPLIAQDQLRVAQDQVAADKVALAATKAGTAQRHQAQLTLDQSQQALDQTRLNLMASGQLTGKEQKTWLSDLETRYKTATGSAKTYLGGLITKLKELQGVQGQGIKIDIRMNGAGLSPGSKAEGGVIPPGQWSWTGELGKELIGPATYPRMVIPHSQSMALASGGSGSGTTNITVALPTTARPDPFETAAALRRLNDFGVLR